ncbi:MAG: hypothetical protein OIF50_17340 [Flavobacteriaceae bacterium]|nr:hypothetical protein [Flavobacteriaceae bacterium]
MEGLYYVQHFIKLVGTVFKASNELIYTKKLALLYAELESLSQNVSDAFKHTQARKKRTKSANQLMRSARKVGKLVYATYEEDSAEHELVKNLSLQ